MLLTVGDDSQTRKYFFSAVCGTLNVGQQVTPVIADYRPQLFVLVVTEQKRSLLVLCRLNVGFSNK